ncbi:MAG: hypothetical protein A2085_10580 [Gemmatimonadetes bacterium GWC2_71_10]|nr:MAG: hypothetical protein A2085_10580 [Gemmatimonadetes bacterium GWC2_71_10]
MTLIAGTMLALLAVALVLEPIVRPVADATILRPDSDDEDISPEQRRRDRALAALKEIEFDQATGKLSDADYQRMYERYAAEAVVAIKEADAPAHRRTDAPLAEAGGVATATGARPKFCEECGSKLEGSGKFCVECGSRVGV